MQYLRTNNTGKIPQKHNSAVHQGATVLAFEGHLQQNSLEMDSQMKTIPIDMQVHGCGDQRVSDLFSPARGKFDRNYQQHHNTMT